MIPYPTVIHPIADINFSAFSYSQVYIPGGVTAVINGKTITSPAGSGITLPVLVSTATGSGFYLLGTNLIDDFKKVGYDYNIDGTISIR